jgi:shikimate kinase
MTQDGVESAEDGGRAINKRHGRPNSIILVGLMGTGKTTVGRLIARQTGSLHIDTDGEIERRENMTVAQIFTEKGEQYFRDAETNFIRRLVHRRPSRRLVLSTGGGLPLRPENADLLRRLGTVIWLRATPDVLVKRVERKLTARPLLNDGDTSLHERMTMLCLERDLVYARIADYIFDTEHDVHASVIATAVLDKCG